MAQVAGAGGLLLAAEVEGPPDGPPIVLLHGGGQTRHSWKGTWRVLADRGWHAVVVDLRGHGDSAWAADGDYSHDALADDVRSIATSFAVPPILVGASAGGVASLLAVGESEHPGAVARALVLVDVAHRAEPEGRRRVGEFMSAHLDGFPSLEDAAAVIAAYNPRRSQPPDPSGLAKVLRLGGDGRWRWHWDPAFVLGKFDLPDAEIAHEHARLERAVEGLKVPTLLVRGGQSDVLSEEGARDFLARAPMAEYADVVGASHMIAGDRNEVFNEVVVAFVERHRP